MAWNAQHIAYYVQCERALTENISVKCIEIRTRIAQFAQYVSAFSH